MLLFVLYLVSYPGKQKHDKKTGHQKVGQLFIAQVPECSEKISFSSNEIFPNIGL